MPPNFDFHTPNDFTRAVSSIFAFFAVTPTQRQISMQKSFSDIAMNMLETHRFARYGNGSGGIYSSQKNLISPTNKKKPFLTQSELDEKMHFCIVQEFD